MTDVIEHTRKHMFEQINFMKRCFENEAGSLGKVNVLEDRIEVHLEELRKAMVATNESTVACAQHSSEAFVEQESRLMALTTERDTLRNRVQVLEMANATSGEVIRSLKREAEQARKALMVARLTEFAAQVSEEKENASCATCDGNTGSFYGMSDSETKEIASGIARIHRNIIRKISDMRCMHSFHPAFPSGELCTFCGMGK